MHDLRNWEMLDKYLYRYIISLGETWYEIHIIYREENKEFLNSHAELYICRHCNYKTEPKCLFKRELLLEGNLFACLKFAEEDYEEKEKNK